jgi:hypothetical protein
MGPLSATTVQRSEGYLVAYRGEISSGQDLVYEETHSENFRVAKSSAFSSELWNPNFSESDAIVSRH